MYPIQSAPRALVVSAEDWAAARGRGPASETENVCVILDTRVICARAVRTATSERGAPTAAEQPVQVLDIQTTVTNLCVHLSPFTGCFEGIAPMPLPPPRPPPCAACFHSCKKCAGPQDYKCLDCKPGWILHDNKCVGESGTGGPAVTFH